LRIGFEITQILRNPPPNKTKGREFDFCCMEFFRKSGALTQNISSMEAEPRKGLWNF